MPHLSVNYNRPHWITMSEEIRRGCLIERESRAMDIILLEWASLTAGLVSPRHSYADVASGKLQHRLENIAMMKILIGRYALPRPR